MPAENKSEEISHLIRDKGYPQKRAVAAAYSIERRGGFKKSSKRKSSRSSGRR